MAWRLDGAKPLSEPILEYCQLDPWEQTSVKYLTFYFKEMHLKMSSGKWRPFHRGLNVLRESTGDFPDSKGSRSDATVSYRCLFDVDPRVYAIWAVHPPIKHQQCGTISIPSLIWPHGANMGPIWGRQDPGGPHVGPMNFAIWGGFIMGQGVFLLKCTAF